MLLVTHVAFALTSVGYISYTALSPSAGKLRVAYLLIVGTSVSGLGLIVVHPGQLGRICLSGIAYLGFMAVAIRRARNKLALVNY